MKRNHNSISRPLTAVLMLFMVSSLLIAQTPTTFNYQAVLRNTDGTTKSNVSVNIGLEIHQTTETGTVVYSETHSATTNEFGMVNLQIGSVTPATFATIDWAAGPYFVEVSVDGLALGTSELLTVPYALHANSVDNIEIFGTETAFSGWDKNASDDFDGAFGSLNGIPAGLADGDDNTQLNESQVEAYINGNETSFDGWDKNAADDIAVASPQEGDMIYYSSGNWIRLPSGTDGEVLLFNGGLPTWGQDGTNVVQGWFQFVTYYTSTTPIAFGFINTDGSVNSGSGNFTCTWEAPQGRYRISITGYSYFFNNYTTLVTLVGDEGAGASVTTNSIGGDLLIYITR